MQISKSRIGRRPKRYSQAERLSRMVRTLASRASTMKDLAQEFDITRRQAYRDLQRIEEEGHPLTHTEEPGERLWQLPLGISGAFSPHALSVRTDVASTRQSGVGASGRHTLCRRFGQHLGQVPGFPAGENHQSLRSDTPGFCPAAQADQVVRPQGRDPA